MQTVLARPRDPVPWNQPEGFKDREEANIERDQQATVRKRANLPEDRAGSLQNPGAFPEDNPLLVHVDLERSLGLVLLAKIVWWRRDNQVDAFVRQGLKEMATVTQHNLI